MRGPKILPATVVLPAREFISQREALKALGTSRMTLKKWRELFGFPHIHHLKNGHGHIKTELVVEWCRRYGSDVRLI